MKKLSAFLCAMVLACSLLPVGQSLADVTFSLTPNSQSIGIGGSAYLDLTVSGLTDGGPDSLGAFALNVNYDDSILSFFDVTFSDSLGDIDNFEADAYFDGSTSGTVYLDKISWLSDWELDAIQSNSFTLATLEFTGVNEGTSNVELGEITSSDAFGFDLTVFAPVNAEVQVNAVPIPSAVWLLGSAIIGFMGFRKKLRKA